MNFIRKFVSKIAKECENSLIKLIAMKTGMFAAEVFYMGFV